MFDKYLHVTISALLIIIFCLFLPLWVAILITLIIGVGKEYIYDLWINKNKADWYDILADVVGILFGSLIVLL